MVLIQKGVEVLEFEEVLLLDYLGVDMRGAKCLDLGD